MKHARNNVLERIISIKETLPNKQKQLCDYLLEHYKDIELFTVKELATNAGVGTTTVLRVMNLLGYTSFFELKRDFHRIQKDHWSTVQKLFGSTHEKANYNALSSVFQEGVNLMDKTLTPQLVENFEKAMDLITHAEKINLLGLRPYKAIAIYIELLIEEFHSKTRQLSYDSESMFDRILQFQSNEVFIIFSFEPETQRAIDAAKVAYEQNTPIILITDQLSSPISSYARVILKTDSSDKHFTIVPIIALVESIVIDLGIKHSKTAIPKLQKLNKTLKKNNMIVDK